MNLIDNLSQIVLGGQTRYSGLLSAQSLSERAVRHVLADAARSKSKHVMLSGGEPTLRADLLSLVTALTQSEKQVSLRTDGLALRSMEVLDGLHRAGVDGIRVWLTCLRPAANDWLIGNPGSTRRQVQALRRLILSPLSVAVEIVLTRPTVPYLNETIRALRQLGVEQLVIRPALLSEVDENDRLMLIPRLSMISEYIPEFEDEFEISAEAIPRCISNLQRNSPTAVPLLRCPCEKLGCGVEQSYVEHFGWTELWPSLPADQPSSGSLSVSFSDTEATRSIRQRILRAAQHRPQRLRICGGLKHPDLYDILRESQRLSVPEVVVVGDLSAVLALSSRQRFRLRGIAQWEQVTRCSALDGVSFADSTIAVFEWLLSSPGYCVLVLDQLLEWDALTNLICTDARLMQLQERGQLRLAIDAREQPGLTRDQVQEWLKIGANDSQWLPSLRLDAAEQQCSGLREWSGAGLVDRDWQGKFIILPESEYCATDGDCVGCAVQAADF